MQPEVDKLKVSLVQYDIAWEDKQRNLDYLHHIVKSLAGKTDIVVLPEMCTTGFTMNSRSLAESNDGMTVSAFKQWASEYGLAICGSFIASENDVCYNRGFFIASDKEYYYDKRHLFRMGAEPGFFAPGNKRVIFEHKGFNICLLICYDLRFPVWTRNVNNEYDLLIYAANWPFSRSKVWNALLTARAIENMCYVCGVNRIGEDGNRLIHRGESKVINARGEEISAIGLDKEEVITVCISKQELEQFRTKFPVWKDADRFEIME